MRCCVTSVSDHSSKRATKADLRRTLSDEASGIMSTRYGDGSSPLLGDRHGLNDPMVRVGTAAAASNLPANEAAAAYSFANRYPRLAKLVRDCCKVAARIRIREDPISAARSAGPTRSSVVPCAGCVYCCCCVRHLLLKTCLSYSRAAQVHVMMLPESRSETAVLTPSSLFPRRTIPLWLAPSL